MLYIYPKQNKPTAREILTIKHTPMLMGVHFAVIIYIRPKKHLKMNKEVRMLLPKKDLIQVE